MSDFKFRGPVCVEDWDRNRSGTASVKWEIEFELREWGVKGAVVSVPEQQVEVTWNLEQADGEEYDEEEVISLEECQCDFSGKEWDSMLCPDSIEKYKGKWKLTF